MAELATADKSTTGGVPGEDADDKLASLPACPVETTLTLIGNKWQVLIVRDLLLHGRMRFTELQRSVGGVSQKVLTSNLRAMEEEGLVKREAYPEMPPRVEYSLTDLGRSLKPVLAAMWDWGEGYKAALGRPGGTEPFPGA